MESVWKIESVVVQSELEALLLEANLIKKHIPPFNVRWVDSKAYPFIKITIKDSFPAVLQARYIDDPKALYFGPYPNITEVRKILKLVRRIFPFVSVKKHPKRICLYYHLGLCPCPQVFDNNEVQKTYKRNIRYLARFLEGKKELLVKELEKQMQNAAKSELFEEASLLKKQIEAISLITRPIRRPSEYIINPNLVEDEVKEALLRLEDVLTKEGIQVSELSRIECYDISNIAGKQGTGSLVVFTNGRKDKSQYRRFKIHLRETPNDVGMMKEVLQRRTARKDWPLPNLIVVDGGAQQLGIAKHVLKEKGLNIPAIGLAKKLEEIYIGPSKIVRLQKDDTALQLLQRIRDEAHRFALHYHRLLRNKFMLELKL